jgi:E3 ubiquitin-protein ligase UHRF1
MLTSFSSECHSDGVHAGVGKIGGISGNIHEGAYSIALSGGYEDDKDEGVTL